MWDAGSPGMGLWVALCLANKITIVDHTALDSCRCLFCFLFFVFFVFVFAFETGTKTNPFVTRPSENRLSWANRCGSPKLLS